MKIKLKNIFLMVSVMFLLFLTDWLLKHFLFDWEQNGEQQWNLGLIAGRSLLHRSTTFFDFMHIDSNMSLIQLLSWIIFALISIVGILSRTKLQAIGIGIILAGILGNTLDNVFNGGVRDIFYAPLTDRGTFDFADVLVVVGGGLTLLAVLFTIFTKEDENVKSNKK